MKDQFKFFISLAVALFITTPAGAEMTASGKFDFTLFSAKGVVISDRVVVNGAFGKKHGIKIRSPFEFQVPRVKGTKRYARYAKELNGAEIKIIFGTEKQEFIESIQLNGLILKADQLKERRRQSASYLKNVVWKQITEKQGDSKIDIFRDTTVNGLPAVELIGRYVDIREKENGTLLTRLVAVLREDSDQRVIGNDQHRKAICRRKQLRRNGQNSKRLDAPQRQVQLNNRCWDELVLILTNHK